MNVLRKAQIGILAKILYNNVVNDNKVTLETMVLWVIAKYLAAILDINNVINTLIYINAKYKE